MYICLSFSPQALQALQALRALQAVQAVQAVQGTAGGLTVTLSTMKTPRVSARYAVKACLSDGKGEQATTTTAPAYKQQERPPDHRGYDTSCPSRVKIK